MAPRRSRILIEILVTFALAATAFWYGRVAFLDTISPPDYYWMSPAITIATGQAFGRPLAPKGTALYAFLTSKQREVSFADATTGIEPPDQFDYSERYLFLAVGYWWKVAGIKWSGVAGVAGVLHALTALGMYAMLRIFTPLLFSLAGALWMTTANLQLGFVPHIRDYSKSGFVLLTIALIIVLAHRARSRAALLAAAAAAGAVIGVGLGFRRDIMVMAPIAVACIVLFRGARPWTNLSEKAQAIAALTLTLAMASYPIVAKFWSKGSSSFHQVLLGYADAFDDGLGIARPIYRVQPYYDDSYIIAVLSARTESKEGRWPPFASIEYDRAGRELWTGLLRHFPADAFARGLAACNTDLNLLFRNSASRLFTRPLPGESYTTSAYVWLHQWDGWGLALGVTLLVVASLAAPRLGALAAFLLISIGGYPALQFGNRHYFHLQAIPVFALLVVIWAAIESPRWFRAHKWQRLPITIGAVAIAMLLATVLPMSILRAYQSRHVDGLLSGFVAGRRTRIEPELVQRPDAKVLLRWPDVTGRRSTIGPLAWAYYMVEFDASGAPEPPAIGLRFRTTPLATACFRVLSVPATTGVVRFGVETYSYPGHEFEGFELEDRAVSRVKGIYRMAEDGPAGIPIELRLPPDWQQQRLYQRLLLEGAVSTLSLDAQASIPFQRCD